MNYLSSLPFLVITRDRRLSLSELFLFIGSLLVQTPAHNTFGGFDRPAWCFSQGEYYRGRSITVSSLLNFIEIWIRWVSSEFIPFPSALDKTFTQTLFQSYLFKFDLLHWYPIHLYFSSEANDSNYFFSYSSYYSEAFNHDKCNLSSFVWVPGSPTAIFYSNHEVFEWELLVRWSG